MACHLTGFAAFPFYFHRGPYTQREHRDEREAEVAFYLDEGHTVGVQGIADGSGYFLWILHQAPEEGMRCPGVEFCTRLGMSGNAIGVTAAEQ